jgi:menaquinone-dependent protoporphyrinogen oxidase
MNAAPRILVAYATKHGSTREVAEKIAETLRECDREVECQPAGEVGALDDYEGVVLGGALYTGRWHRDAVRFLDRHRCAFASVQLAVFAVGPRTLDEKDVEASRAQLDNALAKVPDISPDLVAVFGGVVDPTTLHFPFNRMPASDARDWEAIRVWAEQVDALFRGSNDRVDALVLSTTD